MKKRIENYTFDASLKKVTFDDYGTISLDSILLITNVLDGVIIFNFADAAKTGTVATNVLTLTFDTSSMSDTDPLLIYYDDKAGELRDDIQYAEYRATTAQTDDDIIGAVGATTRLIIVSLAVAVDNATTVDVGVRIGFGATTVPTEPVDGASVTGVLLSHPGIAAGSGMVVHFDPHAVGAAGEELRITNEVPTTGSVKVVSGYYTVTD